MNNVVMRGVGPFDVDIYRAIPWTCLVEGLTDESLDADNRPVEAARWPGTVAIRCASDCSSS